MFIPDFVVVNAMYDAGYQTVGSVSEIKMMEDCVYRVRIIKGDDIKVYDFPTFAEASDFEKRSRDPEGGVITELSYICQVPKVSE